PDDRYDPATFWSTFFLSGSVQSVPNLQAQLHDATQPPRLARSTVFVRSWTRRMWLPRDHDESELAPIAGRSLPARQDRTTIYRPAGLEFAYRFSGLKHANFLEDAERMASLHASMEEGGGNGSGERDGWGLGGSQQPRLFVASTVPMPLLIELTTIRPPSSAVLHILADNNAVVVLNGAIVGTAATGWTTPSFTQLAPAGSVTFANQYYNSSNSTIPAVLHILADNNATISVNGISVGTATAGWATTSYTQLPVNLTAGNNLFSIIVTNTSGPAGLCASLISSNNSVLVHTDSTWTSTPAPVQLTGTQVLNLGNFGMCPWGSTSNFADTISSWIWNTLMAAKNAPAGSVTCVNEYYNSSNNTISATLHILADDSATIFVNGTNIGTATAGWAKTSYTMLPVNLTPGANLISIVATNASGPARLCACLISSSYSVLFHTEATWLSK
ncbi:hypothetical protein BDK51DRAFT_52292, partial [Blyttiomyces helicus]